MKLGLSKKVLFGGLFFFSFQLALFSEINYVSLLPKKYTSISGTDSRANISVITNHQATDDTPYYLILKPENNVYEGSRYYTLSDNIDVEKITKLEIKINFGTKSRSSSEWIWEIKDSKLGWRKVHSFKNNNGKMKTVVITLDKELQNLISKKRLELRTSTSNADTEGIFDFERVTVFYEDTRPAKKAAWTFIFYVAADNDLEESLVADMENEMDNSNKDINIIAMVDRSPKYSKERGDWTNTLLFRPERGMTADKKNALEDWGEVNTGDPKTFKRFLDWTMKNYPAEKYGLHFWGHGSAWKMRETMYDETNEDALHPHEIVDVLKNYKPFEYVAFDSCMMATIEMQTLFRSFARYYVSSQEIVELSGLELEMVFPLVQQNPAITGKEIAVALGKSMKDYTISTVDLGEPLDKLLNAIDEWSLALLDGYDKYISNYEKAYPRIGHIEHASTKDLRDAAREIKISVHDETIKDKSQAVIDAVEEYVLFMWKKKDEPGYFKHMTGGITIFWPDTQREMRGIYPPYDDYNYYRNNLEFSKLTHWDEFIGQFGARNPEIPPELETVATEDSAHKPK